MEGLFAFLMFVVALFLILLVLVQRGRGGGLAGALGGMGGQSAFGTKAGDLFTKITIGVATAWILLCVVSVKLISKPVDPTAAGGFGATAPKAPGKSATEPATKSGEDEPATGIGESREPAAKGEPPATRGTIEGSAPAGTTPQSSDNKPPASKPPENKPPENNSPEKE